MFQQRMNKCSGWLGFRDQLRLARACLPQPITAWSRGFRAFQGLTWCSPCSNHKRGFTGQGPMGAGGRRGPTRASGITALPERALLFGLRSRCGAWPLHPSCPGWPSACSDPHRTAASAIVHSISRLFGKRGGSGGRPSICVPGGLSAERTGGATWQPSAAAAGDPGARPARCAVTSASLSRGACLPQPRGQCAGGKGSPARGRGTGAFWAPRFTGTCPSYRAEPVGCPGRCRDPPGWQQGRRFGARRAGFRMSSLPWRPSLPGP